MNKKDESRVGSALDWIKDTRAEEKPGKLSKPSKLIKQSKPIGKPAEIKSTSRGLPSGWTRATFIVREELLSKIGAASHWERKEKKQVVDEALSAYFKSRRYKAVPQGGK